MSKNGLIIVDNPFSYGAVSTGIENSEVNAVHESDTCMRYQRVQSWTCEPVRILTTKKGSKIFHYPLKSVHTKKVTIRLISQIFSL